LPENVTVCAVSEADRQIIPTNNQKMREGDRDFEALMGVLKELSALGGG
jgi:Trk K+ transport system NAD-binding subunit